MDPIRFAIVGVGNVASALVQGIIHKSRTEGEATAIFPALGFDVHKEKVGRSLAEAIRITPNCATWLDEDLDHISAPVLKGPLLDGLCPALEEVVPVDHSHDAVNITESLRKSEIEVVVILLPTGAQKAAETYALAAVESQCAIVNGMPATIAKNSQIVTEAEKNSVPIIGDDVKSQIGATIIHRALMDVFRTRGGVVEKTIQLDWGGDTDFLNLVTGRRYDNGKRQSKTDSVVWNHEGTKAHISAVDYIPFLANTKEAYTRLEGTIFGGRKVRVDIHMEVEDGYNSAGVLIHAILCAGLAKRNGIGGILEIPSA